MPGRKEEQPEGAFPKGVAKPALRALASIGVTRLDQITRFTESELLALHGMGPKAIRIIKAALLAKGKSLAKDK
jgi:predicted flap endonuclease-1-like 5' DNA nuclease